MLFFLCEKLIATFYLRVLSCKPRYLIYRKYAIHIFFFEETILQLQHRDEDVCPTRRADANICHSSTSIFSAVSFPLNQYTMPLKCQTTYSLTSRTPQTTIFFSYGSLTYVSQTPTTLRHFTFPKSRAICHAIFSNATYVAIPRRW